MSWPAFLWAAQRIMPMETETFSECLVPYCGISKEKSDASTASWDTPETSLPKIKAQVYLVDLERIGGTECGTDVVCTAYVVKNDDDAGFGGFPVLFGSHPSELDIEKFSVACFHLCAISEKSYQHKVTEK